MGIFMDIEERAKEFLLNNDAYKIPVKLDSIAERNNIDVSNMSLISIDPDIDGAIRMTKHTTAIFVEETNDAERKRFTIAHELGHFVFDKDSLDDNGEYKEIFFRSKRFFNEEEARADYFANALLMPRDLLAKDYKIVKEALKDMENESTELKKEEFIEDFLAKKYAVSRVVLSKRLEDLGMI